MLSVLILHCDSTLFYYTGYYSSPVTVKDLVSELEVLHEQDWYALGMMLGLPEPKLKEIGSNYQLEGLGICLRELFKSLLILGKVISWENIAKALLSTALNSQGLAHSIYQKYCRGQTLPYTVQQVSDLAPHRVLSVIMMMIS